MDVPDAVCRRVCMTQVGVRDALCMCVRVMYFRWACATQCVGGYARRWWDCGTLGCVRDGVCGACGRALLRSALEHPGFCSVMDSQKKVLLRVSFVVVGLRLIRAPSKFLVGP